MKKSKQKTTGVSTGKVSTGKLNKLKVEGLNLVSLLNLCALNNISVHNVKKFSPTIMEFELSDKDLNIFEKLDTHNYKIETVSIGGKKKFFGQAVYRIGLVIGLFVSILSMAFLHNRLFKVHIYGLSSIPESEVISTVKDYGIGIMSSLDFDKVSLQNFLQEKFNFSFVSIMTKGNSLLISVKEELPDLSEQYVEITANYNMVIREIKVFSGSTNLKSGDVVYMGQTLVYPYIFRGEEKVFVKPTAEITADVYFSKSFTHLSSEEINIRSGRKKIISSTVSLGRLRLFSSTTDSPFAEYEIETKSSLVSKYFLPIRVDKTYAYELTKTTITRDFESDKEGIIDSLKQSLYKQVPNELNVSSEDVFVKEIENGHIVNVCLTVPIELKYK